MAIAPQAPATPITLASEDLTTISCAANRLVGHFGYIEQDREDIEHDLAVDLLERLVNYDPTRAKRSTFAKNCVEHQISNMIRARGRQRRDSRRLQRLGAANDDHTSACTNSSCDGLEDSRNLNDEHHADLRMDMGAVISGLPAYQQTICALLPEHTPFAISKMLGLSKRETYNAVESIRAAFRHAGLDVGFCKPGKEDRAAG